MKRWLTIPAFAVAVLTLAAAPLFAQTFGKSTLPPGQTSDPTLYDLSIVTITQSASASIISLNSVSCNAGGLHTDNSYYRRFKLAADHGIITPFTTSNVDFGIEVASSATGGGQPVLVKLYTIPTAAAMNTANFTQIANVAVNVLDQSLTVLSVPVVGAVASPTTQDLVVEIFTPSGQTTGDSFFIGSNNLGQTRPSYLAAAACGVTQPTDTAALGFPGMHIVMAVTGSDGIVPTAGNTWGRVKTLYR
jgi:hypothetical protein